MQRTYGRRALRRRSAQTSLGHHEPPLNDSPSPPRKRHKVFVEIVSPKRKQPPPSSDAQKLKLNISDQKPTPTRPESASGGVSGPPKTPEKSPKDSASLYTTPSHHSRSGSRPKRGSIVKRMLGRSKTESSLEGLVILFTRTLGCNSSL